MKQSDIDELRRRANDRPFYSRPSEIVALLDEIERLRALQITAPPWWAKRISKAEQINAEQMVRIEKLERALRRYHKHHDCQSRCSAMARKALEDK